MFMDNLSQVLDFCTSSGEIENEFDSKCLGEVLDSWDSFQKRLKAIIESAKETAAAREQEERDSEEEES
jgi:hypothetical protein